MLAAGDAHVITIKRGLEGVVVPSKMYGILAAGRPIVALAPPQTDAASLGAREGFGVAADPDNPAELVGRCARAARRSRNACAAMGTCARAAASRYARANETLKFCRSSRKPAQP